MKLIKNKLGYKLTQDNNETLLCPFTNVQEKCCGDWCPHFIVSLPNPVLNREAEIDLLCVTNSKRGVFKIINE